ncbi:MAG: flagellar assembly protein H [Candidatus Tectomicrobia bacterium]|uniref:Flagellar assembly protein H n=1 Tax=Tectimicrobiota bacterium TaxID=2528274 RepID=A0A932CPC1_UNCTE|nr:flagellar assembly protein H [Candidatus Tectomicrobia bacterium]
MMDHDRLFKELLSTFFLEFLELFFPETLEGVDRTSLEFLDKEIFTDVTEGERHEVDLIAKLRFREAGQESVFLVHLEHQAQPQDCFPRRMFTYYARFHELHALPIYPIALFSHDRLREEPDEYSRDCRGFEVLRFRFRVVQLNRLNWRDFLDRENPVACALMARMRIAPPERPKVKAQCLRLLLQLRLDQAKKGLLSGYVDSYLRLSQAEKQEYEAELAEFAREEREEIMEITTSWKEEGLQEGLQRGLLEGLVTVLELKFGGEPALLERVSTVTDVEQLRSLLQVAKNAQTVEEIWRHLT